MNQPQYPENQVKTMNTLIQLRNEAFGGRDEQLALALGRPLEQIVAWQRETEEIDEDAEMKIIALANERLEQ